MDEYPKNSKMFNETFTTDASCFNYLFKIRWPDGYECPSCHERGRFWLLDKGKVKCRRCHHVQSMLSGTVFQDTHTPLRTWFQVMWHICLQKNGYSALSLQRSLGFSYPTAWLCLHKLRKAMVRPDRERLSGEVEIDEAYVGGTHEGRSGRGAFGKSIVLVAVERKRSEKGTLVLGRARLQVIPDVKGETLNKCVMSMVDKGSAVITDAWQGYSGLGGLGFTHIISRVKGKAQKTPFDEECMIEEDSPLPCCHRVISLLKRWILGTLQGSVGKDHLQDYLNEFVFSSTGETRRQGGCCSGGLYRCPLSRHQRHGLKSSQPTFSAHEKLVTSSLYP